jgi:hypothetical protein
MLCKMSKNHIKNFGENFFVFRVCLFSHEHAWNSVNPCVIIHKCNWNSISAWISQFPSELNTIRSKLHVVVRPTWLVHPEIIHTTEQTKYHDTTIHSTEVLSLPCKLHPDIVKKQKTVQTVM